MRILTCMQKYIIKSRNKKIAIIFYFLDEDISSLTKEKAAKKLVSKIPLTQIGYAGYKYRNGIEQFLTWIISKENKIPKVNYKINKKEFVKEIKKILEKCDKELNIKQIYIFIFPTVDKYYLEKMNGIGGFCSWKRTIILTVYPTNKWKKPLQDTIVHELAHSLSPTLIKNSYTLGEMFVMDGIAENFRDKIIGGRKSPWTKAIPKKEALKIFNSLKNKLNSKDHNLYREIFFGSKKYKRWTGYTIGYCIVGEYLKKQKKIDWQKIIRKPLNTVLHEIIEQTNL